MRLAAIPPNLVADIWPVLEQQKGINRLYKQTLGLLGPHDILNKCSSGEWLLFCMYEDDQPVVSLVVDIRQGFDGKRVFDVGFCWGTRLDEWIEDVYASFVQVARESGCDSVAFSGRPGWKKLADAFGFKINSMRFVKGLTNGC